MDYPRPLTVVILIGMAIAFVWSAGSVEAPLQADMRSPEEGTIFYRNGEEMPRGGPDRLPGVSAERLRFEQDVLQRKTDIVRQQLTVLNKPGGGASVQEMRDAHRRLIALFYDERSLEKEILKSLRELQTSHDRAQRVAANVPLSAQSFVPFVWPVEPRYGVSSGFQDDEYKKRFGFEHQAIDIPIEQGSIITAAADGLITEVANRGLGFNTLIIAHNGGKATLYGHISVFLVREGQRVKAGDPVAISGGMPGTLGAGMLSTGPHLHFEVIDGGVAIDPLAVLPQRLFNPTWVRVPTELRVRPDFSA